MKVTAILVTRGDVSVEPVITSWREQGCFDEILVWCNDSAPLGKSNAWLYRVKPKGKGVGTGDVNFRMKVNDVAVYGRYAAIFHARNEVIYTQDDDCIIDAQAVLCQGQYLDAANGIVSNMPKSRWDDYPDSCLVGWGALFHRSLPEKAFLRWYVDGAFADQPGVFNRECDAVFTTLTPHVKIDVGFEHLPWAEDPERAMFLTPGRNEERAAVYAAARKVRDGG